MVEIVHHKAACEPFNAPPNSLSAIRACLEADADWIEIDVMALAEGDYVVMHGARLTPETLTEGDPHTLTPAQARELRWRSAPDVPVALLSDVVTLFRDYPQAHTRLQLDYKDLIPTPTDEPLLRLIRVIQPLRERVLVSSMGDWQLRKLRRFAGWLALGFDIHLHINLRADDYAPPTDAVFPPPPYRLGAYGYYDDVPLSLQKIWSTADYLHDRYEALALSVPGLEAVYIRHDFFADCLLKHGFNPVDALKPHGILCAGYTLDADNYTARQNAPLLHSAGVHRLITNTPQALRDVLANP